MFAALSAPGPFVLPCNTKRHFFAVLFYRGHEQYFSVEMFFIPEVQEAETQLLFKSQQRCKKDAIPLVEVYFISIKLPPSPPPLHARAAGGGRESECMGPIKAVHLV